MDKWPGRQNGINPYCNIEYRENNEDSLKVPRDNTKCSNIHIISVPEGGEREKSQETFWRDKAENFSNMGKEIINQIQEV